MEKLFQFLLLSVFAFMTLSCEKDVYLGPPDDPPPQNGKIFIDSKPSGATIYLSGRNMGLTTPDTLTWLDSGEYDITLKMDLFKDTLFRMTAEDKQTSSIFIDYFKNPGHYGAVQCNSKPTNASIVFNDTLPGFNTPHRFSGLFPGYYKVKYTYPEHRADSLVIPVHGGQVEYVYMALVDTSVWVTYSTFTSGIASNAITSIAVDKNNQKWIGTAENGVVVYDGREWKNYFTKPGQDTQDRITDIVVDSQNRKWIATSNGLYEVDDGIWYERNSFLPSTYITSLLVDRNDNLWIGTPDGLVRFDGINAVSFTVSNSGIAANFVTSLAEDKSGRIWIGSNAFGISSFDGSAWKNYLLSTMKLPLDIGNAINAVGVDNAGNIWAAHTANPKGGSKGGITRFDGTSWKQIVIGQLYEMQVTSFYADSKNTMWISSEVGLSRTDESGALLEHFTRNNSLIPPSAISQVVIDLSGTMWVATNSAGLAKYKSWNK